MIVTCHKILVPLGSSTGSALALSAALPLAKASGAWLTLLRVSRHVPIRSNALHRAWTRE
jgi:hypothetical protein